MRTRTAYQNSQEITVHPQQYSLNSHHHHLNPIFLHPKSFKQSSNCCPKESIPTPSHWSYHIRNCISQGVPKEALLIYNRVRRNGIYLLGVIPLILKACASLSVVQHGKALHTESIKVGVESDVMVGTSLVDMYAKCGSIVDSRHVFDCMPERNVVTWNAMIGGYTRNSDAKSASVLFEKMPTRTGVSWIEMISGFARIGDMVIARQLFDRVPPELRNVVTWTVLVDGYAKNGEMEAAKEAFEAMPQRNFFVWSSMIYGYCKKGDIQAAKGIFDRIPVRNLVNWNSLISGYAQNGFCEEALEAFSKMQAEGFEPDEVTLASVLSACAHLGLMDVGKEIHQLIIHKRIKPNQFVLNGLIDMYAKCGDLGNARSIFEGMFHRNDACWNAMISGFAIHGQFREALVLFGRMENSGVKPNDITFVSILSACAHGGLVKEGLEIFSKMEKYGLTATIKHYGCVIDLLGRAGKLEEAFFYLIRRMPVKPNDTVWGALLGACRIHSDMEMANRVLEEVDKADPGTGCDDYSRYVLLSNIYAAADKWEKAERMRKDTVNEGFQKTPGYSSILLTDNKHQVTNQL
ncbi:pentatricopeptide repeat-containing protein At3g21470-like [Cornus florida]|uniref:pentatricopeptide repeat-containing protein At3g21470-like n=1 Tax=Cornus florida TaxID=4283 RepID=UPI0028A24A0B|nr:pentatricopeptide repeat-containing protein At3g21470-like [Cornus florida]